MTKDGRTYRKAPKTRPKKNLRERTRRQKVQKKRLMALGLPEDVVNKMNPRQVKDILKRPAKIAARA